VLTDTFARRAKTWPLLFAISGWERWNSSGSDPKSLHAKAGTFVGNVFECVPAFAPRYVGLVLRVRQLIHGVMRRAFGVGDDWIDAIFADGPDPATLARLPNARRSDVSADILARSEELEAEVSGGRASPTAGGSSKAAGKQAATHYRTGPSNVAPLQSSKSPLARLFDHAATEPAPGSNAVLGADVGEDLLQELRELKDRQEYVGRWKLSLLRLDG
jgi:hypothetical protein